MHEAFFYSNEARHFLPAAWRFAPCQKGGLAIGSLGLFWATSDKKGEPDALRRAECGAEECAQLRPISREGRREISTAPAGPPAQESSL